MTENHPFTASGLTSPSPKGRRPLLSIITPAFNEELNLPGLHARVSAVADTLEADIEWIVVDDHSRDRTFEVAAQLANQDPRLHVIRLARNSGSHNAVYCGFEFSNGDCAVILAADLQDPPETIGPMLERWRQGAQVVWAVRSAAPQVTAFDRRFARWYYQIMRRWAQMDNIGPTGADVVLIDKSVVKALMRFGERNLSIFALISWMGYRQSSVTYEKQNRVHGESGWTFRKKLTLAVDSITSFTFLPVRFFSALGILTAILGFAYAAVVVARAILGIPVEGWSSLMVAVLVLGGTQLLMLGVLGEYLWRALQEARGRPRYLVEAIVSKSAVFDREKHS